MATNDSVSGREVRPRNRPEKMLAALRHVANRPEEEDNCDLHKMLREVRKTKPDAFLDRLQKAEAVHKMAGVKRRSERAKESGSAAPAARAETCEETGRVLDKIEDLLARKPWEQDK